ncbi:MAG: hypothetical protein JWQ07_2302 [Ramlibacter sp.]|jgi:hypothetical protein|nr:hypothetical protein [Ramlibacter sp.]
MVMDIDLLPFSAFALESAGAPALAGGEAQTLTLPLGLLVDPSYEPMGGSLSIDGAATVHWAHSLRAAVVPADGKALSITF